jgi:GT2 family glycosyltransferase/glycosyltransferase involved in cell wall biosynthesis
MLHWVIPDFGIGSGGHMTIFRLIRWLEIFGHDCFVWIVSPRQHRTADAALEDIIKHFQTIRAPVAFADDGLAEATGDGVIATGWQTVARVLNASGFRQRFYLVQDYEPSFHPVGSHALAAAWTYSQDLACICASPWLARLMSERHGRWVSQFWLAYDRTIYFPSPEHADLASLGGDDTRPAEAPHIALYARRSSARRAVELAFLALEHLAAKGVAFHVDLFGDELTETAAPFPCSSHGVLSPAGLAELYRRVQIGICFSATNYSLVPAEMMACGLPVVEVDGEATRAVFPEDVVALTGPHPCAIADGIEALLRDPERRRRQADTALRWVNQFDWETSAQTVLHALTERLQPAKPNGGQNKPANRSARVARSAAAARSRPTVRSPRVTVCIPIYNGGELLMRVIAKVRSQRAPWPFEIVIVDSSSTDGAIDRLPPAAPRGTETAAPGLRLKRIPKSEFQHGRTRNLCASLAHGEFIAFLTQDALPADDFWLYNLVTMLERSPKAAGAFGRHLPYPSADPFTRRDITNHFDGCLKQPLVLSRDSRLVGVEDGGQTARQILHYFSDNNSCLRKTAWQAVPYPEIEFGEDQVWAETIIRLGYEKLYVPSAIVYHSHEHTPTEIAERSATESFFFATMFGYEMYDVSKSFQDQLATTCDSDTRWARGHGVSEADLARRLLEIKAKLYGRALGMEKAKDARRSQQPVRAPSSPELIS